MQSKSEYKNIIVTGVWDTKNGHASTMTLDQRAVDALRKAEVGSKLLIRKRSQESISKSKNPDKAPPRYLEVIPASEVLAFQARNSETTGI